MYTKQRKLNMLVLLAVVLAMGSVAVGQNEPTVVDAGPEDGEMVLNTRGLFQNKAKPITVRRVCAVRP